MEARAKLILAIDDTPEVRQMPTPKAIELLATKSGLDVEHAGDLIRIFAKDGTILAAFGSITLAPNGREEMRRIRAAMEKQADEDQLRQ